MQPHHQSFEGEAHNLVSNVNFLGRFPTKVLHFFAIETPETFFALGRKQRPSIVLVSGKNQDGGKQNGGSPCNLKMTSFAEIVRVADR